MSLIFLSFQVEDVNDNAPVFVSLPYYAAVQVDAEPGSAIFRVSAVDRDSGLNGEVTYSLKEQHRNFQVICCRFHTRKRGLFSITQSQERPFPAGEPSDRRADAEEGL